MKSTVVGIMIVAALTTSAVANPCGFEESGRVVVKGYGVGAMSVPDEQKARLAEFAETAAHRFEICIFAQVDKQGSKQANEKVAQGRADAVRKFLADHGVSLETMKIAKQEEALTFFGLLPDDQAADRRVVVTHE